MFAGRQGLIAADIQDENYLQRQYDLQHTERQTTAACMAFSWRPAARNCSTKLRMALSAAGDCRLPLSAAGDCRLPLSAAARQPLVSSLPFFLSFFFFLSFSFFLTFSQTETNLVPLEPFCMACLIYLPVGLVSLLLPPAPKAPERLPAEHDSFVRIRHERTAASLSDPSGYAMNGLRQACLIRPATP